MTDLDRFKPYNAQYGQQAGDECLRTVAGAIRRCHRRHQDLPARYDGAEFACVLPDTGRPGGRHLAEAIQRSLRDLAIPHGGSETGFVTLSIGIGSLIPGPELPVSALVTTAYQALCRAKANGRNRVED
jgi:diguanylate cyclase (GGDEF)-like protein